jgi:hypothetical protein
VFGSDEVVGCIRTELDSIAKINECEAESEGAVERDGRLATHKLDMWRTAIVMIP